MKKLFGVWMLLCALCVFTACSDDEEDELPIQGLKIPLSETPVKPRASVTIEGQGFTQTSEIWFRMVSSGAESRCSVKATVMEVTTNGITFIAPMVFGKQNVILKEAGKEYRLGEMTFEDATGKEGNVTILPKKVTEIIVLENGNSYSAGTYKYNYDNEKVTEIIYSTKYDDNYNCKYEGNNVAITGSLTGFIEIENGKAVQMKTADNFLSEENTFQYTPAGYLDYITTKWDEEGDQYTETETFTIVNGGVIIYQEKEYGKDITSIDYEYGDYTYLNNLSIDLWSIMVNCWHGSDVGEAFAFGLVGKRAKYLPVRLHEIDMDEEEPGDYYLDLEYILEGEYITNIKLIDKEEKNLVAWEIQIHYEN